MFKLKKVALVLLAVQLCLGMTGVVKSQALGLPSSKTADYDKRIVIWDKPVGYSKKTKIEDMKLYRSSILSSLSFSSGIVG